MAVRTNIESLMKHYPFWKGRGVLANSSLFRSNGREPRLVTLNDGPVIYTVENDYISRMIRFFGDFDPAITNLIKSLLRPGDVVIDIGANLGVVTLPAARWVGDEGLVIAFEPQRAVYDLLCNSVTENRLQNVKAYMVALSDKCGSGVVRGSQFSLGRATLEQYSGIEGGDSCEVRTLDSFELDFPTARLRLIKIDVEGNEANVLSGATRFIAHQKPDYILFESHPTRGMFESRAEVRIIRSLGYAVAEVKRSLFVQPCLRWLEQESAIEPSSSEFLAVRQ